MVDTDLGKNYTAQSTNYTYKKIVSYSTSLSRKMKTENGIKMKIICTIIYP
jgi:hypothetical protein